jgi:putative hydrolase of the HAD superfamily
MALDPAAAEMLRPDPPFDALVVDFGGVLTTPLNEAMAAFCTEMDIEQQDLIRVALRVYTGGEDELVVGFETGKVEEEEFCRAFAARLQETSGKPIPHENLVSRIFSGLSLEESMFAAVIAARRQGFTTALLSNSWGLGLYPHDRFEEMFDVVIISGEVGLRKPDPKIYQLTTERLGLAGERCIFVDDHKGHLVAARETGMTTVLHRTPDETIPKLEELLGAPLR